MLQSEILKSKSDKSECQIIWCSSTQQEKFALICYWDYQNDVVDTFRVFSILTQLSQCSICKETGQYICYANQVSGFHMGGTLLLNGLKLEKFNSFFNECYCCYWTFHFGFLTSRKIFFQNEISKCLIHVLNMQKLTKESSPNFACNIKQI